MSVKFMQKNIICYLMLLRVNRCIFGKNYYGEQQVSHMTMTMTMKHILFRH